MFLQHIAQYMAEAGVIKIGWGSECRLVVRKKLLHAHMVSGIIAIYKLLI